jgi:ZIP family zinc transporter
MKILWRATGRPVYVFRWSMLDITWIAATGSGSLVSLGLIAGALAAVYCPIEHGGIARAMAAGAGMLMAAASLDLVAHAMDEAGAMVTAAAVTAGALTFSLINASIAGKAKHRKRCGGCVQQPTEAGSPGSGAAIAVGTLLDAAPEAVVLGLESARLGAPGAGMLTAFALGNFAEALSSTSGMGVAGRSKTYIFGLWIISGIAIAAIAGASAALSPMAMPGSAAVCSAFAAGALIAMMVEAMIPEATQDTAPYNDLLAAGGFIVVVLLL